MGEILNYCAKNWRKLICQKGQRAQCRAKELLGNQVNHVESNTEIVLHLSEGLNTGKLSKLIRWLIK